LRRGIRYVAIDGGGLLVEHADPSLAEMHL
jgi:hypothetical protein